MGKGSLSVLGKTTANQINVWKDSENNSGSLEFNETDIKDSISIEDGNVTFIDILPLLKQGDSYRPI